MGKHNLTFTQVTILANLSHGRRSYAGFHGMSERGGAASALRALYRKGLVTSDVLHEKDNGLTDEGRKALAEGNK